MIENVLNKIGGVGFYGILSLVIFFLFFIGMLIWVFRLKKSHLKDMSTLPLETEPEPSNENHENERS